MPVDDGISGRSAPRSTPKGAKRRKAIVDVAAALFDSRGYHQTAVDDIAAGAGIRKASLYYHFRSKEEILFNVHEIFGREMIERQRTRIASRPDLSASDNLLELFDDMIGLLDEFPAHVRVFFHYERELINSEFHDAFQTMRDQYESMVEDVIRRGIASGEFGPIDSRLAVQGFFGMCNWTYRWYRSGGRLSSHEVASSFHQIFMAGIASPS